LIPRTVFAPGSRKKWEFRTFDKFVPSLKKKEKKRIFCGQKASIQWKDAKYVLVLFVTTVPRLPANNCIRIMDKGGRPCGKSAGTRKRELEVVEKTNPETRNKTGGSSRRELLLLLLVLLLLLLYFREHVRLWFYDTLNASEFLKFLD
jgi:hypothetical protein